MIRIGVQSGHIFDDSNLEEGFTQLKQAGFDCVDFNIDEQLPGSQIYRGEISGLFTKSTEEILAHYQPHKEAAKRHHIAFGQMHAPFPVYLPGNEDMNRFLVEVMRKSMAICQLLDCPYLVVHPAILAHELGKEEEKRVNYAFYRALIPFAKQYGVKICLENMFTVLHGKIREAVCSDFKEAVEYIDTLNAEAGEELFAFCFDLGHATILGKDIRESIRLLGSRLQVLHVHDNNGEEDLHLMPFTYAHNWGKDLVTDWEGFVKGLHEIGFSKTVSLETYRVMDAFPKEIRTQALSLLAASARYLANRVENG